MAAPGQHWLALINEEVQLVLFDDDSPPRMSSLGDSGLEATAVFARDAKRLAFAVKTKPGAWDVHLASAPEGDKLDVAWRLPGVTAPTLVWGGDDALVAYRGGVETSYLLRVADESVLDIGIGLQLKSAAGHSALVAVSDSRLLYVGASPPVWSQALPGTWLAQLSADGRGLVLFSQSEIPAFDFPILTTRVRWSPPVSLPCAASLPTGCPAAPAKYTPSEVDWRAVDSRIVVEFDDLAGDTRLMDLAFVDPSEVMTLTAPKASFPVLRRNWGIQRNGTYFIAENPVNPSTGSWWLRSVQASGEISRVEGAAGFAQYAASSGDERSVFVISYSSATAETTTYAIAFPHNGGAEAKPLFITKQPVNALWPQPEGPGMLIQTGGSTETAYLIIPDSDSPAHSLPAGLHDVQWTPDGRGVIGILGDHVVYLKGLATDQPITLGRGRYVLPSHW